MKHGRRLFLFVLSLVLLFCCLPMAAQAGELNCYSEGYHHWPGVCLGGARMTVFGADEVSNESATFSTDSSVQNR